MGDLWPSCTFVEKVCTSAAEGTASGLAPLNLNVAQYLAATPAQQLRWRLQHGRTTRADAQRRGIGTHAGVGLVVGSAGPMTVDAVVRRAIRRVTGVGCGGPRHASR